MVASPHLQHSSYLPAEGTTKRPPPTAAALTHVCDRPHTARIALFRYCTGTDEGGIIQQPQPLQHLKAVEQAGNPSWAAAVPGSAGGRDRETETERETCTHTDQSYQSHEARGRICRRNPMPGAWTSYTLCLGCQHVTTHHIPACSPSPVAGTQLSARKPVQRVGH